MLNAIGHAFWERTFALRHRESFPFAGKLGIAVGLDRDSNKRESTAFIEKMMLDNKMAVIATFTDPGHQQCYDCGYGHEAQKNAKAIGKMLGSILSARN